MSTTNTDTENELRYQGLRYYIRKLAPTCHIPNCKRRATLKINFECLSNYMEERVCDQHVDKALEQLYKYIQTDR